MYAFRHRSTGKPTTIKGFQQTLDSLKECFGPDTPLGKITAEQADGWRVWVVNDREGSGRRRKRRTTGDNRLSPATIAKRVSVVKQMFRCAVRWGWIEKSPFDGLRPGSQANPARARYVPVETIRDVLDQCPSVEWKLVVGLARYAGLRCPSEIGAVTCDHVNWEKGRLTVLAKKTEHHGGDHAVRVVPICPELRALLDEAFELAEPGETLVAPMAGRKGANLRAQMNRIITNSGHEPWPRLMQNLRASCETDWVERFPSHVVAKWLGNSPKAAAQHYLMSREHHFESVVTGGSPVEATTTLPSPARGQEERTESPTEPRAASPMEGNGAEIAVSECDAFCDAAGVRTGSHRVARNDRTRCSHSGYSGFFGSYAC